MAVRTGLANLWSGEKDRPKADGPAPDEITPARGAWLARAAKDPRLYLWGKDPETKLHVVRTLDAFEQDTEKRIKPLPRWPVHDELVRVVLDERTRRVAIEKIRQVLASWFLVSMMDWMCRFNTYRRCLYMKTTNDEAKKVLGDRWKIINGNLPAWVKSSSSGEWLQSLGLVRFDGTESVIMTAGENIEEREARGDQIDIAAIDECALHPRLREICSALEPMAYQIILATTPQHGQAGAMFFESIVTEGQEKSDYGEGV